MVRLVRLAVLAMPLFLIGSALSMVPSASGLLLQCPANPNTITVPAYSVPVGEVRVFDRDTTIVAGSVSIAGALLTAPATEAGGRGVDLCIQTENLSVASNGLLCTGGGRDALSALTVGSGGGATGEDGGRGGNLDVLFVDLPGPASPTLNLVSGARLCSGDGGAGGHGIDLSPCDWIGVALALAQVIEGGLTNTCGPSLPGSPSCGDTQWVQTYTAAFAPLGCSPPTDCEPSEGGSLGGPEWSFLVTCQPDPIEDGGGDEAGGCNPGGGKARSEGGSGGDGGIINFGGPAASTFVWNAAPGTVFLGTGGSGGDAVAVGGPQDGAQALGGQGGDSTAAYSSAEASTSSFAANWLSPLLPAFGAGTGGDGGDATAEVNLSCIGNLCPVSPPVPPAILQCYLDRFGALLCTLPGILECGCAPPGGDPCFGSPGEDVVGYMNGNPNDGVPGNNGQAAGGTQPTTSCGVGYDGANPGASCGVSASCGSPATPGLNATPGVGGAGANATGKPGGYGLVHGGRGGSGKATAGPGGLGGEGGKGGDGSAPSPFCSLQPPAGGGVGGHGGAGGSAQADGGKGGDSLLVGGNGGNAEAVGGEPGLGGPGGAGGNGAVWNQGEQSDPRIARMVQGNGASGGPGGFGGAMIPSDADGGAGGVASVSGSVGNSIVSNKLDKSQIQARDGREGCNCGTFPQPW